MALVKIGKWGAPECEAALKAEAQGITASLIECNAPMLDAFARWQPA